MSEGNIRINKVLRELNISLERAVDYLKDKGIVIEASPNTKVSDDVYSILCGQFAGDKGNKEASKGISEEIRKEKEALRIEREKEIEDKRKLEEERQKQQELIKAKATVIAPKQVGKIDLNPKEPAVQIAKSDQELKTASDSSVNEKPKQKKEVVTKKEEVAPKVSSASATNNWPTCFTWFPRNSFSFIFVGIRIRSLLSCLSSCRSCRFSSFFFKLFFFLFGFVKLR